MRQVTLMFLGALVLLFIVLIADCSNKTDVPYTIIKTDTVIVRDTIRDTVPQPIDRMVIRYDTVRYVTETLQSDTCAKKSVTDTVFIPLPIETVVYSDSNYYAVVEGYKPLLRYIETYNKTKTVHTFYSQKPRKWGIGVGVGYGTNFKTTAPYIGVGIQYNILQW